MTTRNCGIPLQQASQYVGILDMVVGTICTGILVADASQPRYNKDFYQAIGINIRFLLTVLLVNAFVTQVMMGIVLLVAVSNKSRSIIKFWLLATTLTAIFTGLPIRVFEMLIVSEFSEELKKEEKVEHISGESSSSQPRGAPRAQPNGSINHGGGAGQHSQQQAGAPPLTIENGVPMNDGSQYTRQLPYNPASQIQNYSVPPALLPPSQSGTLVGAGEGYAGLYPNPNIA